MASLRLYFGKSMTMFLQATGYVFTPYKDLYHIKMKVLMKLESPSYKAKVAVLHLFGGVFMLFVKNV